MGTIGLSVLAAGACSSLSCVEINAAGEPAFQKSLAELCIRAPDGERDATYTVAAASSVPIAQLAAADVIIVDPPRKGLEPSLVAALCSEELANARAATCGGEFTYTQHRTQQSDRKPTEHTAGDETTIAPSSSCEQRHVADDCAAPAVAVRACKPATAEARAADNTASEQAQRLVYLSCGLPALLRDLSALADAGPWQISHAEAFVFYPGSDAIETLVVMDRVQQSG